MIYRKYLYLLLILSMLGTAVAENSVTLNIVPKYIEAGAGETFIISIDVNPNNNNVHGIQFELFYNQSLLEAINIENGPFLRQDGTQTINPVSRITAETIEYAESRIEDIGVKKPGTFAVVTFRVKDNAKMGDSHSFILKNVIITDNMLKELPVELSSGNFIVSGEGEGRTPQSMLLKKQVISQELLDVINKTDSTNKISIKIYVDEKDSVQNLINLAAFLNSSETEVSDINKLSDSITCKAAKQLIIETSSIPFVTQITTYEETSEDGPEKQPGFEIIITVAIVLLTYLRFKKL